MTGPPLFMGRCYAILSRVCVMLIEYTPAKNIRIEPRGRHEFLWNIISNVRVCVYTGEGERGADT